LARRRNLNASEQSAAKEKRNKKERKTDRQTDRQTEAGRKKERKKVHQYNVRPSDIPVERLNKQTNEFINRTHLLLMVTFKRKI